jgi:hypothetical protein
MNYKDEHTQELRTTNNLQDVSVQTVTLFQLRLREHHMFPDHRVILLDHQTIQQ